MAWRSRLSRGRRCAAIFDFHTAPDIPVSFAAALRTLFARDMGGGLDSGVATVRASAGGATASVARPSPDFVIDESQLRALAFVSEELDELEPRGGHLFRRRRHELLKRRRGRRNLAAAVDHGFQARLLLCFLG